MEGNLRFKSIGLALQLEVNLPFLLCLTSVFEGNFSNTNPRGPYIRKGDLTDGFLRYRFGGLIFGGAYTWRTYFRNFTVLQRREVTVKHTFS